MARASANNLVVIGNGMVGQRLLDELIKQGCDEWDITVIGAESVPAYDRVALSTYFDGASRDDLTVCDTKALRAVSAGGRVDYSGMSWEALRERGGVFWPCPEDEHPGTPQLYVDEFWHDDGRARFHSIDTGAVPSATDDDYPLVMTNGRVLSQFLSGNQTMRIAAQNAKDPEPILEVHPDTAKAVGLQPGERVRISSRTGTATVAWKPSEDLRPDAVYLPYHWPECNVLVAADLDPLCKIPAFKYTAVSLATEPARRRLC